MSKGLAKWVLVVALFLGGIVAVPAVACGQSGVSGPVAQGEQSDAETLPRPSKSDDEVRLAMALLIAVAAVALLGTFVYWVRSGDSRSSGAGNPQGGPEAEDTIG